jgi:HD-GYP domain-containing protein (c-di-GMP phosphodiesterase class II)
MQPLPLECLSIALDERDRSTQEHCDRVLGLCAELGRACGLTDRELRVLRLAAVLHDVGKIGIPDTVLKKPGKFDESDWTVMKAHSAKSQRIVLATDLEAADEIGLIVRHHHERFDGRGYPDGLLGEAIPAMARIVAVSDSYDAMARLRIYGSPRPHADIMAELHDVAGQQHDPYCLAKFAAIIERSAFRVP